MNLLDIVLNSQNGALVQQVAKNFGIGESDARNAIGQILPAINRGLQKNSSSPDGLSALLGALNSGKHQRYVDEPASLSESATLDDGNAILGHLFGSKDVSRNVASHAASQTGMDTGMLKKMLPMVAAMAMGSLGKQGAASGLLGSALSSGLSGGKQSNPLASLLDMDNDGSIADDVLNLAKKFF